MFAKDEATTERVAAYRQALVEEGEALEIALGQWKTRKSDKDGPAKIERLEGRISANADELARVDKEYGSPSKSSRAKKDVVEVEVVEVS